MMEFVNGLVENYKDSPPIPIGSSKKWSVSQLPDFITNSIFVDCTEITDHARETAFEEYADRNTPPNSDVILPAPHVGLFVDISNMEANTELPDPKNTNKKSLLLRSSKKPNELFVKESKSFFLALKKSFDFIFVKKFPLLYISCEKVIFYRVPQLS